MPKYVEHRVYVPNIFLTLWELNPKLAEFLTWNNPLSTLRTDQMLSFYQGENQKLVSQQYKAWADCIDLQAGRALY